MADIEKRRQTWEDNDEIIMNAYWKLRSEDPLRRPTNTAIANACGLSKGTIQRHLMEMTLNTDELAEHKKYRDDVIYGLALKAQQGDSAAAKLYFEIVFSWVPKMETKQEIITKTLSLNFNGEMPISGSTDEKKGGDEIETEIVE